MTTDKTQALVTVIIPAYNHEKYIEGALNSICKQTYKNIELIVIDDGSKDSTWEKMNNLLSTCQARFARVEMYTQQNAGLCATLNTLLSLAQGKYIYIIASDDKAKPEAIAKEIEFLENNEDYVLCVGDNEFIDANDNVIGWDDKANPVKDLENAPYLTFGGKLRKIKKEIDFDSEQFGSYETLINGNYIPNGYLIRKSIIDKIGGYTAEAPLEDWFMMLQLAKHGKFKLLNDILFSYRWHSANTAKQSQKMRDMSLKTFLYEITLLKKIENKKFWEIFKIKYQNTFYLKKFSFCKIFKLFRIKMFVFKAWMINFCGIKLIWGRDKLVIKQVEEYLNRTIG